VLDPSAASFREELIRRGWTVYRAENEVLSGIRRTAELLRAGQLVICSPCEDAIQEFGLYRWDTAATGDRVVKEHDHAMDDIRYFAVTVASRRSEGFFAGAVERSG
jgi:phage terminase large subunit